jgi:histidine triad (HIT) family protein
MDDCLFCEIVAGRVPAAIVHETDRTVAFEDIAPVAPLHVLVVPRQHLTNASSIGPEHAEDLAAMVVAAREVADANGIANEERGYRLVFNVGRDSANSVPHLHLHVIGGRPMRWPPG